MPPALCQKRYAGACCTADTRIQARSGNATDGNGGQGAIHAGEEDTNPPREPTPLQHHQERTHLPSRSLNLSPISSHIGHPASPSPVRGQRTARQCVPSVICTGQLAVGEELQTSLKCAMSSDHDPIGRTKQPTRRLLLESMWNVLRVARWCPRTSRGSKFARLTSSERR